MEKSISQLAVEAAIRKIEKQEGIKIFHRCIKNDEIKPLPETFEEMNPFSNMSQREFIIRRELHFSGGKIWREGLEELEAKKSEKD